MMPLMAVSQISNDLTLNFCILNQAIVFLRLILFNLKAQVKNLKKQVERVKI